MVLTCESETCDTCVPAGTCSVTTATTCAFDEDCPAVETCVLGPDPSPRYVDNLDGTVTDRRTCLVWEQKTGTYDFSFTVCPGGGTCADPHHVNNRYAWTSTGVDFDGPAKTLFIDALNTANFAAHSDWRLPKSGGRPDLSLASGEPTELESILTCSAPYTFSNPTCVGSSPYVDPIFNTAPYSTAPSFYWSATTYAPDPASARGVSFIDGGVFNHFKFEGSYVRAVRGGS